MNRSIRVAAACVVAGWFAWVSPLASGPAAAAASVSHQGLWWNAPAGSESGWGINFAHQGDVIFATWFTYDASGKAWWLIALLVKTGEDVYAGDISTVTGPPFNADPFLPGNVAEAIVGTATVTFTDSDNATFAYTVNVATPTPHTVTQTKSITRQLFASPAPVCVWDGPQDAVTATNYQDLWWNAPPGSEAGWGINFTHQGDIIFATWFTYDAAGKPLWLIALLQRTAPGVYSGDVSTVTGPSFDAVPFPSAIVTETIVGTATVTFADGNNASFGYTVNGIAQVKTITRQVFAPPGTVCSTPKVEATAVGTPSGLAAAANIGAAGGSLTSPDGKMTLTIPPNALAGTVAFTIQPVTNLAPGGLGSAYQLLPDGQVFALPAQIVFHYDDEDLAGTFAEALSLGFQDGQGFWHALKSVNLDKVSKTLTGSTTHLSLWSSLAGVQLFPGSARVPVGTSKPLTLVVCLSIDSGDPSSTLQAICKPEGNVRASGWAVNGVPEGNSTIGYVFGSDFGAFYRAPNTKPTPDVVAVSAQIVGLPGGKKYQVVSNLEIEEASWSGYTTVVTSEFNTAADLGWRLLSAADGVFTYVSSGTATYEDARCSVSPSSVPIRFDDGILRVDVNTNTWEGAGVREWEAHFTCPPPEDPYDFVVAVPFLGLPQGAVTGGGNVIEGQVTTENYTITWRFTRNAN